MEEEEEGRPVVSVGHELGALAVMGGKIQIEHETKINQFRIERTANKLSPLALRQSIDFEFNSTGEEEEVCVCV